MGHMTPDERAAFFRLLAAGYEKRAAEYRLAASCVTAAAKFQSFYRAFQSGVDLEVARHPDLAELNVQLDGFYETHP